MLRRLGNRARRGQKPRASKPKIPSKLADRIRAWFNQFRSQHFASNPLLAEVVERARAHLAKLPSFKHCFNEAGELIKATDKEMKDMYKQLQQLVSHKYVGEVVEELEKGFESTLKNRVTALPQSVQIHHLLYKSLHPSLAITPENLILALRKVGGGFDEAHDLFHLVSSAAQGNRWRTLSLEMRDLLTDLFNIVK